MFLAFKLSDLITIPFGYVLDMLYQVTSNYGVALILFAIVVKIILFPVQAKSKKSMMKMSRLSPKLQEIQRKYADDPQRQNEAINNLYKEEGVSMGGGCLWSFVPIFIMLPLFYVIRDPLVYMFHESVEVAEQIVAIVREGLPTLFTERNQFYGQVLALAHITEFAEPIKAAIPEISAHTLEGMNFNFLGINLGNIPTINIFDSTVWAWDWAHIGLVIIPLLSVGSQLLSMWISQKMNNSLVTDKNGMYDEETANNSQAAQTNKTMMWMMPLMSLWIGFTVPAALSLYWFFQGILSTLQDVYLTKKYRKIYDAEDAERLKRHLEQEAIEAEKERIRAEKRAANPEGITANTSKKKLQKKLRAEEEAAKAAAVKEYNAKRGIVEEEAEQATVMSGIPSRPYCKGRNYDPNRYGTSTEE